MPSDDEDVIDVMPAIVENCRSIGEATEAAMVSALAPGSCAGNVERRKIDAWKRRDCKQTVRKDPEHEDGGSDEGG